MNVYDHIEANNRRTAAILCAFPVVLLVMMMFLMFLLTSMSGVLPPSYGASRLKFVYAATLEFYPWVILVVSLWIVFSYFGGDDMFLRSANARALTLYSNEDRDLYRLVENTAIMAGLPMPKLYLIEDESLNAFATGRKPETASIALTEGIVKKLTKAELQGVIAHELAHVGNRDTRLMLITIAGIGCFTFFGEVLVRVAASGGRRSRKSEKGQAFFLLLGLTCLVFGYIVAPLLRFALSRRREYQADATAAKITHDPDALARALEKISLDPRVEVLDKSPMVGNLCIANPAESGSFINFLGGLYATHPPIADRIKTLKSFTTTTFIV